MSIVGSLVLLAALWFGVFFCVLPVQLRSQADAGAVVPGTPSSAPDDPQLKRKFWITCAITLPLWAVIVAVVVWGGISVYDLDVFGVLGDRKGMSALGK